MVRELSRGAHQSVVAPILWVSGKSPRQRTHPVDGRYGTRGSKSSAAPPPAQDHGCRREWASAGRFSRREPVAEVRLRCVGSGWTSLETRTRVEEESSILPDSWRCGAACAL